MNRLYPLDTHLLVHSDAIAGTAIVGRKDLVAAAVVRGDIGHRCPVTHRREERRIGDDGTHAKTRRTVRLAMFGIPSVGTLRARPVDDGAIQRTDGRHSNADQGDCQFNSRPDDEIDRVLWMRQSLDQYP